MHLDTQIIHEQIMYCTNIINVYIDMDRFLLSSLDCDMLLNIADWPPKIDNKY